MATGTEHPGESGPAPVADEPRFVCDVHLGKLARRLRLLGFDTIYRNDLEDDEIVRIARTDRRIALTRDGEILSRPSIRSFRPSSIFSDEQVREVVSALGLRGRLRPFSRCIVCNGDLEPVEKAAVIARIPARSGRVMERFQQCRGCGKIYWPGSHFGKMSRWMAEVLGEG